MLKKIATVISIPTVIGILLMLGAIYGSQAGYSDPLLYVLFAISIIFIMAGVIRNPTLFRKGAKVSTLWLSMSQKLFILNSFLSLLYILSPSLMDEVFAGVAVGTVLTGIALATVIASCMLLIDKYLV